MRILLYIFTIKTDTFLYFLMYYLKIKKNIEAKNQQQRVLKSRYRRARKFRLHRRARKKLQNNRRES